MWKCSWIKVSQTKLVRRLDWWETAGGCWEINCWHCSHSEEAAVWRRVVWADCKERSRRERWLDKQTELRRCCFTSGVYVDLTQDAQLLGRERKSIINMFSKGLTKPQNVKIKLDRKRDKFVSYGNLIWQILLFFCIWNTVTIVFCTCLTVCCGSRVLTFEAVIVIQAQGIFALIISFQWLFSFFMDIALYYIWQRKKCSFETSKFNKK